MEVKQFDRIEDLLGNGSGRYFAEAFRHYNISLGCLEKGLDSLSGTIEVAYHGPARPRNGDVHLGSLEYTALAMRLGGHVLNRIGRIDLPDIARGFASLIQVKVSHSLGIGRIPFRCRLLESNNSLQCVQGTCSTIEVDIGGNRCRIKVDHRGGRRYLVLPEAQKMLDTGGDGQLYGAGYRVRGLHIGDVGIDISRKSVRAMFRYDPSFAEESYHGIGAARHMLLPTEGIQVFGQLMQGLLYRMEATDREHCPNIWLRTMVLQCERPSFAPQGTATVQFDRLQRVISGGRSWQVIDLSGHVGNYKGKFRVAHQIIKT